MRLAGLTAVAAATLTAAGAVPAVGALGARADAGTGTATDSVAFKLAPSSKDIGKKCIPHAKMKVKVDLTTDQKGFDTFTIDADRMAPNRAYTVFLLEQPGSPFGAAEYIGDFFTDRHGDAHNTFKLIVEEAFSSTLVGKGDNAKRKLVNLDAVGVWFADPKDDDFCLGTDSPVTPFDGDFEAGVQVLNSVKPVLP